MKLLFSLFMIPSYLIFPLMVLAGGFVYLDEIWLRPSGGYTHTLTGNIYFALLHLSLATGLTLAVLNFLYVCCMAIFALIIKSWCKALIALSSGAVSFLIAYYLLNRDL
ncbi:MAG: hypothetical protein J6S58_00385 [Lentisphaeria bacterium]|nr:hypothetical protein [Lentisphaeria bacterium]